LRDRLGGVPSVSPSVQPWLAVRSLSTGKSIRGSIAVARTFSSNPLDRSPSMSGINGDKSRFNRERKQKIARRKRNRERLNSLAGQHKPVVGTSGPQTKTVTA
jgi:hypothetical protein